MKSVNKVILIGHVAADPEVRETPKGKLVANFSLATNRDWTSTEGEAKQVTDFHLVRAWGKLATICQEFVKKGTALYVDGRLSNHAYVKDGEKKYVTEIVADTLNMLTWNKKGGVEQVNLREPPQ